MAGDGRSFLLGAIVGSTATFILMKALSKRDTGIDQVQTQQQYKPTVEVATLYPTINYTYETMGIPKFSSMYETVEHEKTIINDMYFDTSSLMIIHVYGNGTVKVIVNESTREEHVSGDQTIVVSIPPRSTVSVALSPSSGIMYVEVYTTNAIYVVGEQTIVDVDIDEIKKLMVNGSGVAVDEVLVHVCPMYNPSDLSVTVNGEEISPRGIYSCVELNNPSRITIQARGIGSIVPTVLAMAKTVKINKSGIIAVPRDQAHLRYEPILCSEMPYTGQTTCECPAHVNPTLSNLEGCWIDYAMTENPDEYKCSIKIVMLQLDEQTTSQLMNEICKPTQETEPTIS